MRSLKLLTRHAGRKQIAVALRAFSSQQPALSKEPLNLVYKRGVYHLAIPLPGKTEWRETAFAFHPNVSVSGLLQSIADEGPQGSVVSEAGSPVAAETTLAELVRAGSFKLELGGRLRPVAVTQASGRDAADPSDGSGNLPALLETAKVLALRELLTQEQRSRISWREFEELCARCSIDISDAPQIAADLHKGGSLLHFSGEPELADSVYLRPAEALEGLYAKLGGVESPMRQFLTREMARAQGDLDEVEGRLKPTLALQNALDAQAAAAAGLGMWGLSGGIVAGAATYWYLTYVYFSWDILEPITFFTGLGITTIGYAWWAWTNSDYEYGNVYDWLLAKSKQRRYAKNNLDVGQLKLLQDQAAAIKLRMEEIEGRRFRLECMASECKPL